MDKGIARTLCVAVLIAAAAGRAQGQGAHVHGTAQLQVTVAGPMLTLRLQSPLETLVGFEHHPRTAQERKAVRAMAEVLGVPEKHFSPSPAARCTGLSSRLDSPVLDKALAREAKASAARSEDARGEGHAELIAEYSFRCVAPDKLQNLEVRLFDSFRRLHRLDVQFVGPRGQKAFRLTAKQRLIAW